MKTHPHQFASRSASPVASPVAFSLPCPTRRTRFNTQGFTLVELLGVITIIAFLAGILIAASAGANKKAAMAQTMKELTEIQGLLEEYRAKYGFYPKALGDLKHPTPTTKVSTIIANELGPKLNKNDVDFQDLYLDPWGYDYRYCCDHDGVEQGASHAARQSSKLNYKLGSRGPDGFWGTETGNNGIGKDWGAKDDITNFNGTMN